VKIGDLQVKPSVSGSEKLPCAYQDSEETWALTPNLLRSYVGVGNGPAGALVTFDALAQTDGGQTFTLSSPYSGGWSGLYVNGLRQSVSQYSVAGSTLSLPADLNVMTGDHISFDYYP
jgi:hypothetical protein